eukprot:scaffold206198_cov47-Prasinocladus_malaysianus.AAC.1
MDTADVTVSSLLLAWTKVAKQLRWYLCVDRVDGVSDQQDVACQVDCWNPNDWSLRDPVDGPSLGRAIDEDQTQREGQRLVRTGKPSGQPARLKRTELTCQPTLPVLAVSTDGGPLFPGSQTGQMCAICDVNSQHNGEYVTITVAVTYHHRLVSDLRPSSIHALVAGSVMEMSGSVPDN